MRDRERGELSTNKAHALTTAEVLISLSLTTREIHARVIKSTRESRPNKFAKLTNVTRYDRVKRYRKTNGTIPRPPMEMEGFECARTSLVE